MEPASPEPDAAAAAFARGDYRALRAELERGGALDPQQRAAVTVDPVHVAVLAACAVGLLAIAAHYLGVGR